MDTVSPVESRIRRLVKVDLFFTILATVFYVLILLLLCVYVAQGNSWHFKISNKIVPAVIWFMLLFTILLHLIIIYLACGITSALDKFDSEPDYLLDKLNFWMKINGFMCFVSILDFNIVGIVYNCIIVGRAVIFKSDLEGVIKEKRTRQFYGV